MVAAFREESSANPNCDTSSRPQIPPQSIQLQCLKLPWPSFSRHHDLRLFLTSSLLSIQQCHHYGRRFQCPCWRLQRVRRCVHSVYSRYARLNKGHQYVAISSVACALVDSSIISLFTKHPDSQILAPGFLIILRLRIG